MMRKTALCLALLCLLALPAGCGEREEDPYFLYYREADLSFAAGGGVFQTETVYFTEAESADPRALAEALLTELLKGPFDETLKSPIPAGTALLSLKLEGSRALVDLSAAYGSLSGVALTLADCAVVMTLTQIPEILSVEITVRGRELAYREQPLLSAREMLLFPEEDVISTVTAALYFLDAGGRLTPEERVLDLYEGDTQVSAVAQALERGPENRELTSALPEGFQVKSVWQEEDICYVNLSSALLEELGESAVRTALEALENSLGSLESVEEIRFLVDGEFTRSLSG
ncbi:GerMN domain-containing protein [uncultured Oscillibacter sp.]|uniref:GerMN domain-containing protein n=1 Tax=uncultured Oscillibacter sp. TaxID=876091 RepID=UPI00262A7766|nr:GerMN domain-containing protein [uncultured Oscillibacter sp.]